MKPVKGELKSGKIIVKNNKDIGRLFQKSRFGRTKSDNSLQLSYIESAFLIEEHKLNVFHKKEKIQFEKILVYAARADPFFEEKYVVYRDLRKRGIQVQKSRISPFTFTYERKDEEHSSETTYYIQVVSEREIPSFFQIKALILRALKKKGKLWLAIVDEEGDITYYATDKCIPRGDNQSYSYQSIPGIVLSNRVVIFDVITCKRLHKNEFFGKPFGSGLQLSLVEALYMMKNAMIYCTIPPDKTSVSIDSFIEHVSKYQPDIFIRYQVFSDLKSKGLVVKTGFKFGTHFRAYQKSPFHSHAEFLIHAIDETYETQWPQISRAVRLAHAVNKNLLFALITKEDNEPEYIQIARIRP